jgi:hypothetical protein
MQPEETRKRRGSGNSTASSLFPASLNEATSADRAMESSRRGPAPIQNALVDDLKTGKMSARLRCPAENIS